MAAKHREPLLIYIKGNGSCPLLGDYVEKLRRPRVIDDSFWLCRRECSALRVHQR